MNHIVNNLWLGGQHDADELLRHNPEGITAILNVRGPDAYQPPGRNQSLEHPGKAYKYIPAPDTGVISPRRVREALTWLKEQTGKHQRILIHCKHGMSRSAGFLAAFMVESGISSSLEEARATIAAHRAVLPATQVPEAAKPVLLVSESTGLPNRHAFEKGSPSPFVAAIGVDLMKTFNDFYGSIAGDALLRRLAKILIEAELDAYHDQGHRFLCKGASQQELTAKLARARQTFRQPFQTYADGRIQTIEGTTFSFAIGRSVEESQAALRLAKRATPEKEPPAWLQRIVEIGGIGRSW